jgi:hypothetical protein
MVAPSLAAPWKTPHRFNLRELIRRLAAENHLWGAPRIHGEVLKLGIAVSERTVSRYLLSAGPSDGSVTDLAYVLREPSRRPGVHAADDVVVRAGR